MIKIEAGHTFLASLGKKRLRPGGKKASKFLFEEIKNKNKLKILEVACNMGTTTFELLKKYKLEKITSCDLDSKVIDIARKSAVKKRLENKTNFIVADAINLPFEDESFDVVINEAMLTMINDKNRIKIINEYRRVLKPNGVLLTHDVLLTNEETKVQKEVISNLSRAINVHVNPLTLKNWQERFISNGFKIKAIKTGPMSLMSPYGMIQDEGIINTLKIVKNALKNENKHQFKRMYKTFKKYRNDLGYIAIVSIKE